MARVRGPLHSLDARGNWGRGALQFRGGNGGVHAYRPAPPGSVNQAPATLAQMDVRDRYREALENWRALDDRERAHWEAQGAPEGLTGWNLYLRYWMAFQVIPPEALLIQEGAPLRTDAGAFLLIIEHWMEAPAVPSEALLDQDGAPLLTLEGLFIRTH